MSSPTPPKKMPSGNKEIAGVATKWWLIGGGGAVIAVWYIYHRSNAGQVPSDAASTDPSAADAYGYDSSGGSYGTADSSPASSGAYSGIAPVAPPASYTSDGTLLTPHTTAAWIAEAEAVLLSMGYSPDAVAAALGAYAAGAPLTPTQAGTVASAAGQVGAPPGTVTTHVPPPTTAPVVHKITVHNVLVGVKVPGVRKVKLSWTPVPYATEFELWKDGAPVAHFPSSVHTFTTHLLSTGKHTWWVQAKNSVSHLGGNQVSVTIR